MATTSVQVWYVLEDDVAAVASSPRLQALLATGEVERADRFRMMGDRHRHLVGRILARLLLSHLDGTPPASWSFPVDGHGRPHAEGGRGPRPPGFSITHTDGLVACAAAQEGEVGLDAEATDARHDLVRIAGRFFAPSEVALVNGTPEEARASVFYALWTLKEAYVKARGEGITLPLDGFAFDPFSIPPAFTCHASVDPEPERWSFTSWKPSPRHAMALAVRPPRSGAMMVQQARVTADDLEARASHVSPAGKSGAQQKE